MSNASEQRGRFESLAGACPHRQALSTLWCSVWLSLTTLSVSGNFSASAQRQRKKKKKKKKKTEKERAESKNRAAPQRQVAILTLTPCASFTVMVRLATGAGRSSDIADLQV
jgi:hypothetical protein